MTTHISWPLWRKSLFRFFFILIALQIAPLYWLNDPVTAYAADAYAELVDSVVGFFNAHLFHVRRELVPVNGSGDTSFAWAQEFTFILLAAVGCILWSVLDRKRKSYDQADYWLRTFLRYFLVLVSFSYGYSKLFLQQMPYPSQSLMATPLGDLLPMRLSWAFIGYSPAYQVFGGVLEIAVGILLLFRRTTTAGLLLGASVYGHVLALNLGYDIPVKIYSLHYFFYCVFLLVYQWRRLLAFLTNRAVPPYDPYRPVLHKKWMRITKVAAIVIFVFFIIALPLYDGYEAYSSRQPNAGPFSGVYDVGVFVLGGDTISAGGDQRWRDMIFDDGSGGSVGTTDTAFRQRYGRGYFNYQVDTAARLLVLTKYTDDYEELPVCELQYQLTGNGAQLRTMLNGRDLYAEIVKSNRRFQLAGQHFHWLSEYNR